MKTATPSADERPELTSSTDIKYQREGLPQRKYGFQGPASLYDLRSAHGQELVGGLFGCVFFRVLSSCLVPFTGPCVFASFLGVFCGFSPFSIGGFGLLSFLVGCSVGFFAGGCCGVLCGAGASWVCSAPGFLHSVFSRGLGSLLPSCPCVLLVGVRRCQCGAGVGGGVFASGRAVLLLQAGGVSYSLSCLRVLLDLLFLAICPFVL